MVEENTEQMMRQDTRVVMKADLRADMLMLGMNT